MKKKIVLLAVAFGLLLPGVSALAHHEQGLLYGQLPDGSTANSGLTDGDHSTYGNVGSSDTIRKYSFSEPRNINGFYVDGIPAHVALMDVKFYDTNNNLIQSYKGDGRALETSYKDKEKKTVDLKSVSYVTFGTSSGGLLIYEIDVYGEELADITPPGLITNVTAEVNETTAVFNYSLPADTDFSHLEVYQNDVLIQDHYTGTTISLDGLQDGTTYDYSFISVDKTGNKSTKFTKSITTKETPKPAGEIENLTAKAEFDRVDLSWNLPESEAFKHVNIYRDEVQETALIDQLLGTRTAYAASTKIFETNGTYFNDLTVDSETTYEYTLTTSSTFGIESEGVTKTVETPEAPPPEIIGGEYTKDPATGDFIYSWDEPTEGQVKVQLDGVDYKTVDSADQQIRIPKSEIKYDSLGSPLISLQPIGENGKVGEVVAPGTIKDTEMPFGPSDLLGAGVSLFGVVGGILILFLSFLLVPRLIRVIKKALGKESAKEAAARNERTRQRVERLERNKKASAAERLAKTPKSEKETKEPKTAVSDRIASTERQRKQTLSYATGPVAKEPRTKRERIEAERQTKAPRIPRERNRRERTPRERG